MKFQIKHRFTNAVLFECGLPAEIATQSAARQLGYAVKQAVSAGANLADADLADAYLADAYLAGAYLAGAYLAGADLADAYLAGADLAGANLAGARNVPADVGKEAAESYEPDKQKRYAKRAAKFRERNPDVPVIPDIDSRILGLVDTGTGKLDMGSWHSCETTHCRAGWAITLAGDKGRELEAQYGPHHAGRMIYIASTGRVPSFFASNEAAMADLRECATQESHS